MPDTPMTLCEVIKRCAERGWLLLPYKVQFGDYMHKRQHLCPQCRDNYIKQTFGA